MRTAIKVRWICSGASLLLAAGCAHAPPQELVLARSAYDRAAKSEAAQLAPAEVHKAQQALTIAEQAYQDDPGSQRTRDLGYVAERKARLSEALAELEKIKQQKAAAEKEHERAQGQMIEQTQGALAKTQAELDAEREARRKAEQAEREADEMLERLVGAKKEARGTVITLSGSVLFSSNKATLLPSAERRLNEVAEALLKTKERQLVIEGHTDAQGSINKNLELSQRRAEAVKNFLVSKGYDSSKISAQGLGKERPVADNASAEGRANNRRVEIVVAPETSSK